jgi:hypothetical protein
MTKLFRDVDYFITQASNSTQREFELDFADVIDVFDTNSTDLTTEDGRTLAIYWYVDGYYQGYQVLHETEQMSYYVDREVVKKVIELLKSINIDGETMQYIIEKVGMSNQIMRQLMLTEDFEEVEYVWEELKSR